MPACSPFPGASLALSCLALFLHCSLTGLPWCGVGGREVGCQTRGLPPVFLLGLQILIGRALSLHCLLQGSASGTTSVPDVCGYLPLFSPQEGPWSGADLCRGRLQAAMWQEPLWRHSRHVGQVGWDRRAEECGGRVRYVSKVHLQWSQRLQQASGYLSLGGGEMAPTSSFLLGEVS